MSNDIIEAHIEGAKAVQESSKAISKAIDGLTGVGNVIKPLAEETVGLATDWVKHKREMRRIEMAEYARKKYAERGIDPNAEDVSLSVVAPIVEAAIDESRPEIKRLWDNLFVNATDSSRRDTVRIEFIDTIKRMHPNDALILKTLYEMSGTLSPNTRDFLKSRLQLDQDYVEVSIAHLEELKCVSAQVPRGQANWYITPFGRALMRAVAD